MRGTPWEGDQKCRRRIFIVIAATADATCDGLNIINRHARATLLGEMMFIARNKTLDRDACCHARVSDHVAISTCGDSRLRAFGVSRTITAQEMDRWYPNILYIYTRSGSYSCFISFSSNLSFEWPSISRDNMS